MIKTGSDFSGVGAFDQALSRLGIIQDKQFACDWDKYARQTYIYNYGEPKYYPSDVYDREIPTESLDIYMTSPPCQSFSLAGKRQGEDSDKGVLFYNSHEFITKNKPRYFIFENVKGLLSDNGGKTFQKWIDYLGGKSVNGNPVIFPNEQSVPYHVYYQVMNAKHYGVPQNRERVFIIGIRDDSDNEFSFPKPFHLEKRLKDVLENEVDEKYFLSDKMVESITYGNKSNGEVANLNKGGERGSVYSEDTDAMSCLSATDYKKPKQVQIGAIRGRNSDIEKNNSGLCSSLITVQKDNVVVMKFERTEEAKLKRKESLIKTGKDVGSFADRKMIGIKQDFSDTILASPNPKKEGLIMIPTNNSKGYDLAKEEDSINFSNPNSETRRDRVGHGVAQTLDTACNQGILVKKMTKQQEEKFDSLVVDENIAGCITHAIGRMGSSDEYISSVKRNAIITQRIRRLTPKECFALMDFNEDFYKTINFNNIANSQGILLSLQNKIDIKWNVKESDAKEKQKSKECVCFTIKEIINTEMKILNLTTHIEEIQNAPLKIAMEWFIAKDIAQNTTILTENGAILYLVKNNNQKLLSKQGKELLILEEKVDLDEKENHYTDYYLRLTLEENLQGVNTSIILTTIQTITNYLTYIYSIPKENTISVILNYKNCQKNFLKGELLNLKMGNTILSDSQLYKQAGNSIVVNCLVEIIKKFKL